MFAKYLIAAAIVAAVSPSIASADEGDIVVEAPRPSPKKLRRLDSAVDYLREPGTLSIALRQLDFGSLAANYRPVAIGRWKGGNKRISF